MITFKDKSTQRIFDQYQKRIDKITIHLSSDDRKEIKLEIVSHLHESMQKDGENIEIERLLNAIDRLGELEEYLGPLVADKLIERASITLKPAAIIRAFIYNLGRSVKRTSLLVFCGVIYLFVLSLLIAGVAKLFIPEIGLYLGGGSFAIGIIDRPGVQEVLGFWITPLAFALAAILYILTTKIMRVVARKR